MMEYQYLINQYLIKRGWFAGLKIHQRFLKEIIDVRFKKRGKT
jgi:hypothetical protein